MLPAWTTPEPYLPCHRHAAFIRDMMEFVELTERDVVAIRSSAPVVLRHAEALTAALYEKFLALPRSARFFRVRTAPSTPNGWSGASTSLARWHARPGSRRLGGVFLYLLNVGIAHSHRAHDPGGQIPPHLMVGAMSLAQTALAGLFDSELERSGGSGGERGVEQAPARQPERAVARYLPPQRIR